MSQQTLHPANKATITHVEPQLWVRNVQTACKFYCDKLGFTSVFSYGEPPFYAQVTRDSARLNLRFREQPLIDSAVIEEEELLSGTMTVATPDEIQMLYLEFKSAGVNFHQPLQQQPWGAQNFIIKDLDGNLLLFAGPALNH